MVRRGFFFCFTLVASALGCASATPPTQGPLVSIVDRQVRVSLRGCDHTFVMNERQAVFCASVLTEPRGCKFVGIFTRELCESTLPTKVTVSFLLRSDGGDEIVDVGIFHEQQLLEPLLPTVRLRALNDDGLQTKARAVISTILPWQQRHTTQEARHVSP